MLKAWVLQTRARRRATGVAGLLLLGLSIGAGVVVAQQTSVATYTGCLAVQGGTISLVAQGSTPLKPCGPGAVQIRLSRGDITSVAAGAGLIGGGSDGDVNLALATSYQLPQSCLSGAIPSWTGSAWVCGSDTNTTYTAGTGLDLNGTTFSVESAFRLPQTCQSGQVAKSTGRDDPWTCAADQTGTATLPSVWYTSYPTTANFGFLPGDGQVHPIISLTVPAGNYLVQAPVEITAPDTGQSTVCTLRAGGTEIWAAKTWDESDSVEVMTLVGPASLPSGGTILVECSAFHENRGLQVRAAIPAQQVGTISVVPRQ